MRKKAKSKELVLLRTLWTLSAEGADPQPPFLPLRQLLNSAHMEVRSKGLSLRLMNSEKTVVNHFNDLFQNLSALDVFKLHWRNNGLAYAACIRLISL